MKHFDFKGFPSVITKRKHVHYHLHNSFEHLINIKIKIMFKN